MQSMKIRNFLETSAEVIKSLLGKYYLKFSSREGFGMKCKLPGSDNFMFHLKTKWYLSSFHMLPITVMTNESHGLDLGKALFSYLSLLTFLGHWLEFISLVQWFNDMDVVWRSINANSILHLLPHNCIQWLTTYSHSTWLDPRHDWIH